MRVKKSEIKKFWPQKPKKKEPSSALADVLAAIKSIKTAPVEPVIVEPKIPDIILEQQRELLAKISEVPVPPDYPTYHFEVHRNSEGFIKSVDATPTKVDTVEDRNVANTWYKND